MIRRLQDENQLPAISLDCARFYLATLSWKSITFVEKTAELLLCTLQKHWTGDKQLREKKS
jgi:hypothetical protein